MPARSADDVRIETYSGPRDHLRRLFELAEDSAAELDSYIDAGRVLVATSDGEIMGHLQLTGTDDPRQVEIKNMAVREDRQGQGVGRRRTSRAPRPRPAVPARGRRRNAGSRPVSGCISARRCTPR